MNTLTVIGSINLDTTLRVKDMPRPGETIHSIEHFTSGGGKGANQAVSGKRAGAYVNFIGAIGDDAPSSVVLDLLNQEHINTTGIQVLKNEVTGQAFIMVDQNGENSIIISAGANNKITPQQVQTHHTKIAHADFVIGQLESDLSSTIEAFQLAKQLGTKTILNPAPALSVLPKELLHVTDILIPNETETEILTGIKITDQASMKKAAKALQQLGVQVAIITLGHKGAYYNDGQTEGIVPAFKVEAVDTTAAGDTFIGALASSLKTDFSNLKEAILFGNKASSIAVTRFGAQPSIPYLNEIKGEN